MVRAIMKDPKTGKQVAVDVDAKDWICLYPAYIDAKRSESKGRKVSKELAVEAPNVIEMNDSCRHLGLMSMIEDKRHPADFFVRGRIRVKLKDDKGKPLVQAVPTRKALLREICKLVPNHMSRQKANEMRLQQKAQAAAMLKGKDSSSSQAASTSSSKSNKKNKKKGKGKKKK
ncbi:subunit Srp19 of signal recognition particle complex [Chloropicon primus]|uniref:Subunit Srp19 of signal recognition particle complex n=1 Tax=Chloropicon primus TaxID=1764295 RepID=A0A5B8MR79_9CHLO|nr:subunit Srp19 of signal recognition particle complex [Chloropicon primus]UPR01353.1 subunit Srp19 of signal recognition particle complex [Chloropicon primus]|eukprot:QDZ22135.1 subunit Srp19 of signal recognition particle complex [Chloropicon primus]